MIATTLAHAAWRKDKPAVASFVGMRDVSIALRRAGEPGREPGEHLRRIIPLYKTPLNGVAALAAVTRYALWREADHGEMVRPPGLDRTAAHALIDAVLADSPEAVSYTHLDVYKRQAVHPPDESSTFQDRQVASNRLRRDVHLLGQGRDLDAGGGTSAAHDQVVPFLSLIHI